MTYRAVILDLFGTLVPTFAQSPHEDVLEQIAKVLAVPHMEFRNLWVDSYDDRASGRISVDGQIAALSAQLGREATSEQIAQCMHLRLALARECLVPRPDAIATLRTIRGRGLRTGLISDCSSEPATLWPKTLLAPLVDVALFSCVEGTCKPDPRLYLGACTQLEVEPSQCLYVGDGGSRELSGAASVGMHAVQLRPSGYEGEPLGYDDAIEPWEGTAVPRLAEIVDLIGESN